MDKKIISQGKTTNEAIENGLKELKVSKDMVEVKVIEEEKRSFYNILAPRVVKVELTLKENNNKEKKEEKINKKTNENEEEIKKGLENIEKFLKVFLKKDMNYTAEIKEYDIYVEIKKQKVKLN